MAINSVIISGLLYLLKAGFSFSFLLPFMLVLIGLTFAHAPSNLFTDYWGCKDDIDTSKYYFRPAYMPHPPLSGMMTLRVRHGRSL